MTHYPSANLNKSLPIMPVKAGKFSTGDWVVMLLGAIPMAVILLALLPITLVALIVWFLVDPMFFRELMAPQRNPFAVTE